MDIATLFPSFFRILGVYVIWALILSSCTHDPYIDPGGEGGTDNNPPPVPCEPGIVYFNKDIFPLINTSCAVTACHDRITQKDGVVLTSYQLIMKYVKPGLPLDSKLYKVLVASGSDRMPRSPVAPWTSDQINLLKTWISQGAKDNACAYCDPTDIKYSTAIRPLLDLNCVGCHNATLKSGQIDLTTYSGVRSVSLNGRLLGAVTWSAGFSRMPSAQKLSDCEIGQIHDWIQAGSPEN